MNHSTPAHTRTFRATVHHRPCGENWGDTTHTVTLTRTAQGITAEVNGQPATLEQGVRLLNAAARVDVLSEELMPLPATIGNRAARDLHLTLARLGYRDHYTTASEVLERPVSSLAALTAEEAVTVRSYGYGQLGLAG